MVGIMQHAQVHELAFQRNVTRPGRTTTTASTGEAAPAPTLGVVGHRELPRPQRVHVGAVTVGASSTSWCWHPVGGHTTAFTWTWAMGFMGTVVCPPWLKLHVTLCASLRRSLKHPGHA